MRGVTTLAFAAKEADHLKIGEARGRLLCGRTIAQVEAIHRHVVETTVPAHAHHGLQLVTRKHVAPLIAELERYVLPSEAIPRRGQSSLMVPQRIGRHPRESESPLLDELDFDMAEAL